jgi:RNA polymerase sigma-70 factor (ECF subfamily)
VPPFDATGLARIFRDEHGKAIATLVRQFGDIDVAEEAVQEAFVIATRKWPETGTPPNPGAWILVTARNRALDRLRRESSRHDRYAQAALIHERNEPPEDTGPVRDDRLRLIFTCCHPALALPSRIALTLRLLGGLETGEIARSFLVPEATMAQRLVRAKKKISGAKIPYRVPVDAELPERLSGVLTVLYLVFNEGYTATGGDSLTRADLCEEAIRLTRLLVELMPDEPEVHGLLALMLLIDARRPTRTAPDGTMVLLADQDRSLWKRDLIEEGQSIVRALLRRNTPGPFQIQAAINAVHSDAPVAALTDWSQIVELYDMLLAHTPTPIVALNRAVAVAEVDGPEAALAEVDALALSQYHLFHATRGELLVRLHRPDEAAAAFEAALQLTTNPAEQALLHAKLDALRT